MSEGEDTMKTYITTARMGITCISLAAALAGTTAVADQVILDDLIVDGSACIGFDCVNGESFGFDTLRLKENNLRIRAVDTSSSASFPSNDWQITFNDSSNGGANKFSIDDIDGGRTPFTLEAGAPSHSLYVDDGGKLGLGTSTPVVDVHVKSGNTPTLRLEQDGSSGFTPQTWDIAGNEANFFIRDATNGSKLVFRIQPGAPGDSIFIANDGDVGMGTAAPNEALHVRRTNGEATILVEEASGTVAGRTMLTLKNNGPAFLRIENTALGANERWVISHDATGSLGLNKNGASNEFLFEDNGDLTILGSLITTGGGGACTVADPCDAVFNSAVYEVPSIEEHAAEMWENQYLPAVGPTGPDAPINMTKKMLRILNELEHAHIYIDQLNNRLEKLETALINKEG